MCQNMVGIIIAALNVTSKLLIGKSHTHANVENKLQSLFQSTLILYLKAISFILYIYVNFISFSNFIMYAWFVDRYKLEIYVKSGDSQYCFVFWDTECAKIIGKSAVQMRQLMIEVIFICFSIWMHFNLAMFLID
jgi:hypothetical protein